MSKLVFDGATHQIALLDNNDRVVGTWPAYNNIDSHATIQPHLANGSYRILDRNRPHPHAANPNGPYGIIRFAVPGHVGVGVHSGRANARHLPGPQHPTMGCIRTTDEAMRRIGDAIRNDPLTLIRIGRNSQAAAHSGRARQGHGHVQP